MDASDYNYDTQTYRTQLSAYGNSEEILHDIQSASTNIVYEGSIFFSITDLDHNLTYRNQTYHDSLANKISNQANLLIKEIMESL
jgi:hypothetical protein